MTDDLNSELVDDVDPEEESADYSFDLTFYGADYPVDGLVKRLANNDIVIPTFDPDNELVTDVEAFQRKFVWKKIQCDRFVESLLLGLPVPGIFLVQQENKRLLVLDGQQRLVTLAAFYSGVINKKEFALEHVQKKFKGATYKSLEEADRRTLDDSIIHATVIKRTAEGQDLGSVYSLFERLNSGGTQLSAHEIRVALVPGPLMHLVREMNAAPKWREIFGPVSKTLKDHELVLRFLALRFSADKYKSPMKDYLTSFAQKNREPGGIGADKMKAAFSSTVDLVFAAIGKDAFRIGRALNAAVFDSVMIGVSERIDAGPALTSVALKAAYEKLLTDKEYLAAVGKATAREDQVAARLTKARNAFAAA
ncbi:DUF262 domain-containing protein [uncultured Ramlibacter sp.]|uniref:DUF262 domain-containing protein n=1 Tax=uncultured Ramlibacter sp. TaxID=260755 RepID=UPI002633B155|nr:DUF262 domain-containing protein [uncultured Ramlibacter sp.]